jgi:peptidoglycan/LPS O-acetylase OafA/YrhL
VIATHFFSTAVSAPWGSWGVGLFFTLSGFLITQGLLKLRADISTGDISSGRALGIFWWHRVVRLWPLYFAMLATTCLLNVGESRALLPWNASFLLNHNIADTGVWPGLHSHLWTLSVEHQFYLLWPFVVLYGSRRFTHIAVIAILVIAPLIRVLDFTGHTTYVPSLHGLLLSHLIDVFAWGALLALVLNDRQSPGKRISRNSLLAAVGLGVILYLDARFFVASVWRAAFARSLMAISVSLMIAHCVSLGDSPARWLLRLRPLVYVGTISYGVYLLHNFMPWLAPVLLRHVIDLDTWSPRWILEFAPLALTMILAIASWHCFERPLARLGRSYFSPPKFRPSPPRSEDNSTPPLVSIPDSASRPDK